MAVSSVLKMPAQSAPLGTRYVTPHRLNDELRARRFILGIVDYSRISRLTDNVTCPVISVDMPLLGNQQFVEVWTSDTAVSSGKQQGISYSRNETVLFGAIEIKHSDQIWLDRDTYQSVSRMLSFIKNQGYPHLLRIWNYLPEINAKEHEIERYQLFCLGRHQAFSEHGYVSSHELPAASALGTKAGSLWIYFLAATLPGLHRENPRQLSAYSYPRQYGARSPSFARATLVYWGKVWHLYISGTASIVGHISLHVGDVRQQLGETITNIKVLIEHTAIEVGTDMSVANLVLLKVYIRHAQHYPVVKEILEESLGEEVPILYLQADICRGDLLLEIEGVCVGPANKEISD